MFPLKPYDQLTDPQRLWFLSLAMTDLGLARKWAALVAKAPEQLGASEFVNALHDAAVVSYCRPFSGCNLPNEERRTLLPPQVAFGGDAPALHVQIKDLRNEVIAHNDMRRKDVLSLRLDDTDDGNVYWRVVTQGAGLSPEAIPQFVELCSRAINQLYRIVAPMMHEHVSVLPIGGVFNVREWLMAQLPTDPGV